VAEEERLLDLSPEDIARRGERVNHPAHYGGDITYEPIKFIEFWKFGFHLGNAIKYMVRFQLGKPGVEKLEDLKKAAWYINRKIEKLEEEANA
jgi:Protein of unknwon function (DUF3310)